MHAMRVGQQASLAATPSIRRKDGVMKPSAGGDTRKFKRDNNIEPTR